MLFGRYCSRYDAESIKVVDLPASESICTELFILLLLLRPYCDLYASVPRFPALLPTYSCILITRSKRHFWETPTTRVQFPFFT